MRVEYRGEKTAKGVRKLLYTPLPRGLRFKNFLRKRMKNSLNGENVLCFL
jgi:hypothetical protein